MRPPIGRITESEAAARGLTADHMTLDENGDHVFTDHAAGVQWDLTSELPDNPPLPSWSGGLPPVVEWPA
jgi:hypothetical protein